MRNALAVMAAPLLVTAVAACTQPSEANEPAAQATSSTSTQPELAPELDGTYTLTADGSRRTVNGVPSAGGQHVEFDSEWEIVACRPGCVDVTSSAGWSARMWAADGRWSIERQAPWNCDPDTIVTSTLTYEFDVETLAGTFTESVPCVGNSNVIAAPVTLTPA